MDALYCIALLYSLFVFFGLATNGLIIIATITSKCLQNTCNILIACCAFSDILHQFGHLPKIIPIVAGRAEISSLSCCLLQIIPNFGVSSGTILVLCISLDRFIAIRFSTFAGKWSVSWQLAAHFAAILTYAAIQYALIASFYEDTLVICTPPEAYHGAGKQLWALANILIYAIAIGFYAAVWRSMRKVSISEYYEAIELQI